MTIVLSTDILVSYSNRIFHVLWSEESKPYLSHSFQAIHSLCQYEKEQILGKETHTL